jgi:hypothetical protein
MDKIEKKTAEVLAESVLVLRRDLTELEKALLVWAIRRAMTK